MNQNLEKAIADYTKETFQMARMGGQNIVDKDKVVVPEPEPAPIENILRVPEVAKTPVRIQPEIEPEPEPEFEFELESELETTIPEPEFEPEPEHKSEATVPEPEFEPEPEHEIPEPEFEPESEVKFPNYYENQNSGNASGGDTHPNFDDYISRQTRSRDNPPPPSKHPKT